LDKYCTFLYLPSLFFQPSSVSRNPQPSPSRPGGPAWQSRVHERELQSSPQPLARAPSLDSGRRYRFLWPLSARQSLQLKEVCRGLPSRCSQIAAVPGRKSIRIIIEILSANFTRGFYTVQRQQTMAINFLQMDCGPSRLLAANGPKCMFLHWLIPGQRIAPRLTCFGARTLAYQMPTYRNASSGFLDRLASQLKVGRHAAYRRAVQRVLRRSRGITNPANIVPPPKPSMCSGN